LQSFLRIKYTKVFPLMYLDVPMDLCS
jgi:hypothetical protein